MTANVPPRSLDDRPELVGHRGFPALFPENSIAGFDAAIKSGAHLIECDVQMTADQQLVLLHDATLSRTAGIDSCIFDLTQADLAGISVHEPARFSERFRPTPVPTLEDALSLLPDDDSIKLIIEVKQESLDQFGIDFVMTHLHRQVATYASRVIIISFNDLALEWFRDHSSIPVGWILKHYRSDEHSRARELAADLLLIHYEAVKHESSLWPGDWRWLLYGIDDPHLAQSAIAKGAQYVETNNIAALLSTF